MLAGAYSLDVCDRSCAKNNWIVTPVTADPPNTSAAWWRSPGDALPPMSGPNSAAPTASTPPATSRGPANSAIQTKGIITTCVYAAPAPPGASLARDTTSR